MFGSGDYSNNVLAILKDDFAYEPDFDGPHEETFKLILERTKAENGNEYDAAIMFMVVQMSTLITFSRGGLLSDRSIQFIQRQLANCRRLLSRAGHGEEIGAALEEIERSALARRE